MNSNSGKRGPIDDINERRKRRRTISNDLLRGIVSMVTASPSSSSESSSADSTYDSPVSGSEDDSDYGPSYCEENVDKECTKCNDLNKVLENQNEILNVLKDIKKENENIQKSVLLQIQMCRQEIVEQIETVKKAIRKVARGNSAGRSDSDEGIAQEIMDEDSSSDDDQDVYR